MTGPLGMPTLIGVRDVMTQQATIQRDEASVDEFGARGGTDWQTVATVPCFLWWGTGTILTRMGSTDETPAKNLDLEIGGMIVPEGTDITPRDRILQVVDAADSQIAGVLEVLAVGKFQGVTEISMREIT